METRSPIQYFPHTVTAILKESYTSAGAEVVLFICSPLICNPGNFRSNNLLQL
jgi:hypothetical protein